VGFRLLGLNVGAGTGAFEVGNLEGLFVGTLVGRSESGGICCGAICGLICPWLRGTESSK
jgi:hypothetical protein